MEKHAGGRPLKFKSVEELQGKIEEFFWSLYDFKRDMFGNKIKDDSYVEPTDKDHVKHKFDGYVIQKVKVATVTELAVYLDTYRDVLMDYENGKYDEYDENGKPQELTEVEREFNQQVDQFSNTIKKAKQMIYADTEQQLFVAGKTTGAIFSLKNNYSWRDKTEQELTNPDGSLNPFSRLNPEELRKLAESL